MSEDPTIEVEKKPRRWPAKFWNRHGERIVFMIAATLFGLGFYYLMPDMKGEAKAILVGVAMLCYNKARSGMVKEEAPEADK